MSQRQRQGGGPSGGTGPALNFETFTVPKYDDFAAQLRAAAHQGVEEMVAQEVETSQGKIYLCPICHEESCPFTRRA